MRSIKQLLFLLFATLAVTGCRTTITNLTPTQVIRNQNGFYPFEVAVATREQSLVQDTIKAYVVVGLDLYPMQPTPLVKNRWETLVPIPADKNILHYRYKIEYQYLSIPKRRANSKLSSPCLLKVRER